MKEIILHYILFLIVIFGNGFLIYQLIKSKIELNFFEISFFGIIFSGFLAYVLNFFFPLNQNLLILNLILSICIIILNRKSVLSIARSNSPYIFFFFFLSLVSVYASGFSDDLTHYHGSSIVNLDHSKIIVGSNLMHHHFGYNSIWFYLHAYLNFDFFFLQDIHVLNAICFFLTVSYFFNEFYINKKNRIYLKSIFFLTLIFFLIKYTRLKEFGIDRPGILLTMFLILFYFKKNCEILDLEKRKIFLRLCICSSFFLMFLKIFFIFSFVVPLFIIIKTYKVNKKIYLATLHVTLFLSLYIIKNILISGCMVYPISYTCINFFEWNSKEITTNLFLVTEASTKSFDMYKGYLNIHQYIENFNWLKTWFLRNHIELIEFALTTILCLVISLFCFRAKLGVSRQENLNIILLLSLFFVNLIIFIKTPVVRYHHILFISFILLLRSLFSFNLLKKTKIILIVLIISYSYNLIKNWNRISKENFINDPINHLKKINWYYPAKKKYLGNFTYYIGWNGGYPIGNMDLSNAKHKKILGYDIIYK